MLSFFVRLQPFSCAPQLALHFILQLQHSNIKKFVFIAFSLCVTLAFWLVPRVLRATARRIRLIWLLRRIEGPLAVPILGTTWQMAWKTNCEHFCFAV